MNTYELPAATIENIVAFEDTGDTLTANFLFYKATIEMGISADWLLGRIDSYRNKQKAIATIAANAGISLDNAAVFYAALGEVAA